MSDVLGEEQYDWRTLFLDAFAEGLPDGEATGRLIKALWELSPEERERLSIPAGSNLDLYEFIMREGARLLLLLET